jgi:hypothetical protein
VTKLIPPAAPEPHIGKSGGEWTSAEEKIEKPKRLDLFSSIQVKGRSSSELNT